MANKDNQEMIDEWQRLKVYTKIFARRGWYYFRKKVKRSVCKWMFFCGAQLISMSGVSAQIVVNETQNSKEYLAKANAIKENPNYREFVEEHEQEIKERQEAFAKDLWQVMSSNIKKMQEGIKKGRKTQALKEITSPYKDNKVIAHPRFYCSSAAISSVLQTIQGDKYPEYEFLLGCLSNPNSCPQIIKDLNKNYGEKSKTNDVKQALKENFQKNPRSVCIAIVESRTNSSSGLHFTMVFSEQIVNDKMILDQEDSSLVALDSVIVSQPDSVKGVSARFNINQISNIEDYYVGSKNKGFVFNITEMVESDLIIEMYEKYLKTKQKTHEEKSSENKIVAQAQRRKKELSWAVVSKTKQEKDKVNSGVYRSIRSKQSDRKA